MVVEKEDKIKKMEEETRELFLVYKVKKSKIEKLNEDIRKKKEYL